MNNYQYLSKTYGGTTRMWRGLEKMLNVEHVPTERRIPSVKEYIEAHPEVKTEERVSKKGVELIKLFLPNGKAVEYEKRFIDRIGCYNPAFSE